MSKSILVSAGHGGGDPGAVGHGYTEAAIALQLRDKVAAILRTQDCTVFEDGADGVNDPLKKAIGIARTVTAAGGIAVEFHLNASTNPTVGGIECLSKPKPKLIEISKALCAAVRDVTGFPLRGGAGGWKSDSSGQHPRLGFCEAGGVILELGFISNPNEAVGIAHNLNSIAQNIATVLLYQISPVPAKSELQKLTHGENNNPQLTPTDTAITSTDNQTGESISNNATTTTQNNTQDINTVEKIKEPEPHGFWSKIKTDIAKLGVGNIGLSAGVEYAKQAQLLGLPVSFWTRLIYFAVALTVAWFAFRLVHYLVDSWKQRERVRLEAEINTDPSRKNMEWVQ